MIIGFIVPVIALFFAILMIAISVMKKKKMNATYINPNGQSYEIDIVYLILAIVLVAFGSGALSIDSLFDIW